MTFNEGENIWLFENDLAEYRSSDEGIAVNKLLDWDGYDNLCRKSGVSSKQLEEAFENYWNARNDSGLHYSNEEARLRARATDELESALYAEQD